MKYYINGFRYGRSYFMSFGWSEQDRDQLMSGEVILRDGNEFWIINEEV